MTQQQKIQTERLARQDLDETFADSFGNITFDGQTWRFEFCVTRMEEIEPPATIHAKAVPVCRLVLTPKAGFELAGRLSQIVAQMEKQGVIKKVPVAPMPSGKPN